MRQRQSALYDEPDHYGALTYRWKALREHEVQKALWCSRARYNVVPAGRRSGKTEIVGKRKLVRKAMLAHDPRSIHYRPDPDPRFFAAAPTRDQVKRIYWNDLKALVPRRFMAGSPNESQLIIRLINGSEIHCLGMDKPERAEGVPWDYGILDEYGNMKAKTWPEHIRPTLSDRGGSCDFIGVPEGRNHYYDQYKEAMAIQAEAEAKGVLPEWCVFHWISADILPASEIDAAKRDLDELTYLQEYEASFVNFTGRAYWAYDEKYNTKVLQYDPRGDLIFCFDFNVAPGVAAIVQERQELVVNRKTLEVAKQPVTAVIGEVYIPRGSNTVMVCDKLVHDWGAHRGRIFVYGDSTGGAAGTAKVLGSDWALIKRKLWHHYSNERVFFRVPQANPKERDRVNSVNSRCCSMLGWPRLLVDPGKAPHVDRDLEGVTVVEGGSGELDKKTNPELTHISDGLGYYVHREYPVRKPQKAPPAGGQWK